MDRVSVSALIVAMTLAHVVDIVVAHVGMNAENVEHV